MLGKAPDELVPILVDYNIGTLGGQDVAVVLQFARSPEDLQADITSEIVLAMTLEQAQALGAGLIASVKAATLGLAAANDPNTPQGLSRGHDSTLDKGL